MADVKDIKDNSANFKDKAEDPAPLMATLLGGNGDSGLNLPGDEKLKDQSAIGGDVPVGPKIRIAALVGIDENGFIVFTGDVPKVTPYKADISEIVGLFIQGSFAANNKMIATQMEQSMAQRFQAFATAIQNGDLKFIEPDAEAVKHVTESYIAEAETAEKPADA